MSTETISEDGNYLDYNTWFLSVCCRFVVGSTLSGYIENVSEVYADWERCEQPYSGTKVP
ncbi:hypothetical protein KDW_24480 [Dictyobacter vulcani]|uniref:Uncharacterized protein n=1 Tax=Dictyobacter vulcani TaxID=2607529 RepID=A0A5J4KSU9_9CHLR|nr:hypothetical protein KDW_24480 [Dictyobacter vulcani]